MVKIMQILSESRKRKKLLVFHLMPERGQFMSEQYYVSKKYHEISILATETAKRIVKNETEWTKYLEVAARLYKYPFADQMLIYAQRPGANARGSGMSLTYRTCIWQGESAGDRTCGN